MWLDRLSGQSTPSGSPPPLNRSHSPGPRRASHLSTSVYPNRSNYSPRTSSLSLASNASSTSLVGSSNRQPNGSTLRQSVVPPAPNDITDPQQVLRDIIGLPASNRGQISGGNGNTSKESVPREGKVQNPPTIDFGGQTLQELAQGHQGVEKTGHHGGKDENRANSVEKYEKEKDTFEDLHKSILGCDDVLKSVELYLTSFQTDLGVVSAEIESLQSRSTALNQKLDNRKGVERVLGPMVEEFSISPAIVRKISEGTIDDAWIASLAELEHRSKTVETKAKEQPNTKAIEDAKPLLRNLISRALEVIRDYLVAQIKALRSPNINAQIIQRQSFLRYKALYAFLARHHPTLAEEIGQAYINTMRWYYLTHFTRYQKALEKMKIFVIEKQDVLGADESARKGNLLPSSKAALSAPDAFNLGRRLDLLKTTNETALASYLAEENKTTHHLEVPFRNFNLALVDNASAEFSFMAEFFAPDSFHRISRRFSDVFGPTFALGQALTRSLVEGTADGLGVLMCVRLNQRFAFELQRRRVPAVESYVNGTNMLLWPRFQMVMDLHCDSLRRATSSTPRGAASALSLSGPASTAQSAAPLPTTQRFAQLLQGILALSSEAGDDEPVSSSLGRLRNDFEAFLTKLSKAVGDGRRRERFLFNNYSLVLTIIEDTAGKLAAEQKQHFEGLRQAFRIDE